MSSPGGNCNCDCARNVDRLDVEDELDVFFIRRRATEAPNAARTGLTWTHPTERDQGHGARIHENVPLLLHDVERLAVPGASDATVFQVRGGGILFRSCLVYGRVVGRIKDTANFHRYMVDDGTALLPLHIYKNSQDLAAVGRLRHELRDWKRHTTMQHKNKMAACLQHLLAETAGQLDNANIPLGSRVLVCGKPNHFRDCWSVKAFKVYRDAATARNIEIAFKDHLIDWYTRRVPCLLDC